MRQATNRRLVRLLVMVIFIVPTVAQAQTSKRSASKDFNKSAQQARKFVQSYGTYVQLRKKFEDPAFERYVDLKLLGKAWDRLDSTMLTDVALQLAYAEDVLQRKHKKISADAALNLALKLAIETNDSVALTRLEKAAVQYGKTELAVRIQQSNELNLASRSVDPAMLIAPASMSAKAFASYRSILSLIKRTRILEDKQLLATLENSPLVKQLPDTQRKYVELQIANLREAFPIEETADTPTSDAQDKASENATDTATMVRIMAAASRAYDAAVASKPR